MEGGRRRLFCFAVQSRRRRKKVGGGRCRKTIEAQPVFGQTPANRGRGWSARSGNPGKYGNGGSVRASPTETERADFTGRCTTGLIFIVISRIAPDDRHLRLRLRSIAASVRLALPKTPYAALCDSPAYRTHQAPGLVAQTDRRIQDGDCPASSGSVATVTEASPQKGARSWRGSSRNGRCRPCVSD